MCNRIIRQQPSQPHGCAQFPMAPQQRYCSPPYYQHAPTRQYSAPANNLFLPCSPSGPQLATPSPGVPAAVSLGFSPSVAQFSFSAQQENGNLIISVPVECDIGVGFVMRGTLVPKVRSITTVTTKDGKVNKYTVAIDHAGLSGSAAPDNLPLAIRAAGKDFEVPNVFRRVEESKSPKAPDLVPSMNEDTNPTTVPPIGRPMLPPLALPKDPEQPSVDTPTPRATNDLPTELPKPPEATRRSEAVIADAQMSEYLDVLHGSVMTLTSGSEESSCFLIVRDEKDEYQTIKFEAASSGDRRQLWISMSQQIGNKEGSSDRLALSRMPNGEWKIDWGAKIVLPNLQQETLTLEERIASAQPEGKNAGGRNLSGYLSSTIDLLLKDTKKLQLGTVDRGKLKMFHRPKED